MAKRRGKRKSKKWVKKALKYHTKGALHRQLRRMRVRGVKMGKKIPTKILKRFMHETGKLGKRVRLALTMRGFKHKRKKR